MVPPREWSDAGELAYDRFHSTAIGKEMTKKVGSWQVHHSVGDNRWDAIISGLPVIRPEPRNMESLVSALFGE